jgi:hypothetical protein
MCVARVSCLWLPMPLYPSRILVTSSSRLYLREISRSFTTLNERSSSAPKKPRVPPPLRTPNTTRSPDVTKRPQTVPMRRRLLQPYELSMRLITLCERGDADLAFNMLQNAPKNAQNVKVWNTLIQQCMNAEKYKLAFVVFIDVRPPMYHPLERLTYPGLDEASRFHAKHQDICDPDEWVCDS